MTRDRAYMAQGQPSAKETYARYERRRQKEARNQKLATVRQGYLAELALEAMDVELPFGDEMDIDF